MSGFLSRLWRQLTGQPLVTVRTPESPPRVRTRHTTPRRSTGRVVVEADTRPLYESKGWRREGNRLVGAYRLAGRRSFAGEIDLANPHHPSFYITNAPKSVLNGDHAACFRRRGRNRYLVHFARTGGGDVDAGIVAVEKLLHAALNEESQQ